MSFLASTANEVYDFKPPNNKVFFNPKYKKPVPKKKEVEYPILNGSVCYWSVADKEHGYMMQTCINSARKVGVGEPFVVFTDKELKGKNVHCHPCGDFDKHKYMFKFHFLRKMKQFGFDYLVFLDADNFFVRHPGGNYISKLMRNNKWFVQLESEVSCKSKRDDWWGCSTKFYKLLLQHHGVKSEKVWNTNAGFWIVKNEHIDELCDRGIEFWEWCKDNINIEFTEEAPLAWLGHLVSDPELNTFEETKNIWGTDWTGCYKGTLPDNNGFKFENYMSGETQIVSPAIVHAMRSKPEMIEMGREICEG